MRRGPTRPPITCQAGAELQALLARDRDGPLGALQDRLSQLRRLADRHGPPRGGSMVEALMVPLDDQPSVPAASAPGTS